MAETEIPTSIRFDGEQNPDVEKWLGENFQSWLPSTNSIVVRFPDGFEATVRPGDTLRRTPEGALEIWHA